VALTEFDRDLLQRCLNGEAGSWRNFVDRFIGLFVHVIQHTADTRSVKITREDIDDLCAEIFVNLCANDMRILREFRNKSSLATYLSVIARRIVVREVARRRMAEAFGHSHAHQASLDQAQANSKPQQPRDLQRIEDAEEIQQLLQGLPPQDAEVVRLFHLEGCSYREIADRLTIPENSIGPTLTRARDRMRARQVPVS